MSIISGVLGVFAASKRKAAVRRAARLEAAVQQEQARYQIEATTAQAEFEKTTIEDRKAYQIAEIGREVKRVSGRQTLAYAAAGVEITSATPQTMIGYTARRGSEEISHVEKAADRETSYIKKMTNLETVHVSKMLSLGASSIRLKSKAQQKEITFSAWSNLASSAGSTVTGFLGSWSGGGFGGTQSFGRAAFTGISR